MLQSNDIGVLFATMQAAYGHSWAHDADAIPVWQAELGAFSLPKIMLAAEKAIKQYPDFPPSLGQFSNLCSPPMLPDRPSTYLPGPQTARANRFSNRVMLLILMKHNGVDQAQLKMMVQLKNALVEELGEQKVTREWLDDVERQLNALAEDQDLVARQRETDVAQQRFARA